MKDEQHLPSPPLSESSSAPATPESPATSLSLSPPGVPATPKISIADLRSDSGFSLKDQLVRGLADGQPETVPGATAEDRKYAYRRRIDTLCLYSDRGLEIYEHITALKEYYVFPAELEILREYGDEIACRMFGLPTQLLTDEYLYGPKTLGGGGDKVHRLGNGNAALTGAARKEKCSLEKTRHLLQSLSKVLRAPNTPLDSIEYRALDVERASLEATLEKMATQESDSVTTSPDGTPRVVASGIAATYDEGLSDLVQQESSGTTKSLLWLGSSIGNFNRDEAAAFLKNISDNVLKKGDTMLIGVDNCSDGEMIATAYDDPQGVTQSFIFEGVDHAGRALHGTLPGQGGLASKNFDYVSRWNAEIGRHEAYVRCKVDNLSIPMPATDDKPEHVITLQKDEMVAIEVSYKYSQVEALALFNRAGLRLVQQWTDSRRLHSIYLLEKPDFHFPLTRTLGTDASVNPYGAPSMEEWETMWKYWDNLTLGTITDELLMTKPIPLRHIILFYLGHIPAFAGIHLSKYFDEPRIDPAYFAEIFERGIDPDVDNPDVVNHSHSVVPTKEEDWPAVSQIVDYQRRVRERIRRVYEEESGRMTRRLSRVLFIIFEHEAMHAETLVYIAIQAKLLNPAPGFHIPDFKSLSASWDRAIAAEGSSRSALLRFPSTTVTLGHDDDDRVDEMEDYEPHHELGWDVEHPRREVAVKGFSLSSTPISNGEYLEWVRSLEMPSQDAFLSSWDSEKGSVFDEDIGVKTLYGLVPMEYAKHWPAAGSALQLGAYIKAKGGRFPTHAEIAVFHRQNPQDSATANVGFANLHPVPPMLPHKQRDGSVGFGSDGGVWLWTEDRLAAHEGYVASTIYPGYSSDFHDGTHQIILGGSYATPPRLVRPTFVNWYQTGYPYVLAGARIAYDC
ncbi:hypothetical protein MNV49_004976 [Pseudohyphozyma bogoriensis]|nr:hypothetical protein MNV49_004976 [Pseudohyphozyma bogoriensis]